MIMRKLLLTAVLVSVTALALAGCGKVGGPRFWWDDRNQARMPEDYTLPEDASAASGSATERPVSPTGQDLTDENLRDYRTDLDLEEERRKSEASLFNF